MNLYPCCSATPAQTTLADAPINVPLPEMQRISIVAYLIIDHGDLPPKQAPKANAHTSG